MTEEKIEIEQIEEFTEDLSDEALDREGAQFVSHVCWEGGVSLAADR